VGARPTIDRCRILGDPVQGTKGGTAANAPMVTIQNCYISDCFGPYPGSDTQAICAWDSPGPFSITNNYLCGGSETIMFGGADPANADRVPSDILISGNTITKRAAWQSQLVGVKNTLELKNAKRVRIEDNDIRYSWGGHGQDGFLLMLTPRNQSGTAPYSTVEDVVIEGNRFQCAAGALSVLGTDNNASSGRLSRVTICHNRFEQLDPKLYVGTNTMIQILDGPQALTINANEFVGMNSGSQVYFDGAPLCEELVITNNV